MLGSGPQRARTHRRRARLQSGRNPSGPAKGLARSRCRRAAMLTAAFGAAFGVLMLVAIWLHSTIPGARTADQKLIDYYEVGDNRLPVLVGLYVMPFAGIAFIWFMVALRGWITTSTTGLTSCSQTSNWCLASYSWRYSLPRALRAE